VDSTTPVQHSASGQYRQWMGRIMRCGFISSGQSAELITFFLSLIGQSSKCSLDVIEVPNLTLALHFKFGTSVVGLSATPVYYDDR